MFRIYMLAIMFQRFIDDDTSSRGMFSTLECVFAVHPRAGVPYKTHLRSNPVW